MRRGECMACGCTRGLCLSQLTCSGLVWCVGCEELVEYVRCVWLGAAWVERGLSG